MKRVANCILRNGNKVLMLKKPKYGWWVVPGGKMEPTESIEQTIKREFFEETNLKLVQPTLKGVFTIVIQEDQTVIDEWMMFTFYADEYEGELNPISNEGILEWKNTNSILSLPKAKGDNVYLEHILKSDLPITGSFYYTPEYKLISYHLDQKNTVKI